MSRSSVTCPSCGHPLAWRTVPVEFQCGTCERWLRARAGVERFVFPALFLGVCVAGSLATGQTRSVWSTAGTLIILFRILQLALFRTWIVPPRIELRDGVPGVVSRPPVPVTTGPVLLETPPIARNSVSEVSGKYRSRLFEFPDPPHTFEGLMLGAALVFILSTQTVVRSEPLIAWFYPEYRATKVGPEGFPVTLHIGRDALNLANRSNQDWMCELRLGTLPGFRMASAVRVRTLGQADLDYSLFQGVDGQATAEAAARAAREQITVRCTEPSGRTHYRRF